MALYTSLHFHNVPLARQDDAAKWFDDHQQAVSTLEGFRAADRFEVTPQQVMADIPQPWQYLSVYDFDYDQVEQQLPALAQAIALGRADGLFVQDDTERLFTYRLYSDWTPSPNWQADQPLSGVSVILGNYTPGRYDEYMRWYDDVHGPEVSNVPGHVAMKRGALSDIQMEPKCYCPGDQLVMAAQQTDDLAFTIGDFINRAIGQSPSGIAMEPRSQAGSTARTVHYFCKISGAAWPGGIAYAGDLSVYPNKS